MSASRLIFVMTFIMIDYGQEGWGPQWLFGPKADWFKITNMAFFAITNGYTSTQCAIQAPSSVVPHLRETVGTFIGFFITLGIMTGSFVAIAMAEAVPHNG